MFTVIKYKIYGCVLYAVEDKHGYIAKYCNSKSRAEEVCMEMNNYKQEGER